MTENDVFWKIRGILADSLGVEEDIVTREASLEDDLGAESIDYLDVAFRMERAFGISIKPEELLVADSPSEEFLENGRISDAGMAELRRRMPHVQLDRLEQSRDLKDFRRLITVDSLVKFTETKIKRLQEP
jgi:acyl carrier protein